MRLRTVPRIAQLIAGLALIALCLGLVVDTAIAGLGLWLKDRSDEFVALPTSLEVSGIPNRSVFLDARGNPIGYLWEQNRAAVPADRISPAIGAAMVAVEDARFYEHRGVDLQAMARAVVHNLTSGEPQGGSTITQQYVKNLLLTQAASKAGQKAATAPTYRRKLAEARYAVALSQRMSKADVLTGYLNLVYFGRGAYGVQAAAEAFFATDAAKLTTSQAALLAGLVKSPAEYDPFDHPEAALARRNLVLDRMATTGKLTADQAAAAKDSPLGVRDGARRAGCGNSEAGYFCDWVLRRLLSDPALGDTPDARRHRLDTGGIIVRTTLDRAVQRSTQRAVNRVTGSRAAVAAVVQQPGTGAVLAMAASVPYGVGPGRSSVNLPLGGTSGFQAGSTFKIFVLAKAIQDGLPLSLQIYAPQRYTSTAFAPYNVVNGRPTPYTVGNAADSESGVFTLEQATWHSVNTYFMQLEERVWFTGPADIAESMGVRRSDGGRLHRVPSFTLGTNEVSPLAMSSAVATFSAHGRYCPAFAITSIRGTPVKRPACRQVLDAKVADTATKVLTGVIREGTGHRAAVPGEAAGKTGTVQDFSAAWFIGYTPRYAATVWMGDPRGGFGHPLVNLTINGTFYKRMYGGDVPAEIWREIIKGSPYGQRGDRFGP